MNWWWEEWGPAVIALVCVGVATALVATGGAFTTPADCPRGSKANNMLEDCIRHGGERCADRILHAMDCKPWIEQPAEAK